MGTITARVITAPDHLIIVPYLSDMILDVIVRGNKEQPACCILFADDILMCSTRREQAWWLSNGEEEWKNEDWRLVERRLNTWGCNEHVPRRRAPFTESEAIYDFGRGWRTGCGSHPQSAEQVEELEECLECRATETWMWRSRGRCTLTWQCTMCHCHWRSLQWRHLFQRRLCHRCPNDNYRLRLCRIVVIWLFALSLFESFSKILFCALESFRFSRSSACCLWCHLADTAETSLETRDMYFLWRGAKLWRTLIDVNVLILLTEQ